MPAPRRLLPRLALLLGALLVALVAAELIYRAVKPAPYAGPTLRQPDGTVIPLSEMAAIYRRSVAAPSDPSAGPRGRCNLHVKHCFDRPVWPYFDADGCVSVDSNSLGFRDREFAVAKAPDEYRILAVGDSFTLGSGVQLEDTWPQVLETLLRARRTGPVEVINAGFAAVGHEPPGYIQWLTSDGVRFSPDVLILGLCLNDLGDIPMLGYPIAAPEPWLGGISELLEALQREWAQRALLATRFDYAELLRLRPEPWNATKAALIAIRDLCAQRGIRYVVAILPMMSCLGENCPYVGVHAAVRAFCAEAKIECVDLLPQLRGRDERELWVHPTDQHPNHVGNRLLAAGIAAYLQDT